MMNSVHSLPTELPREFVGKNDTSSFFFLLCFKFFSHGNYVCIYRGNISVGKISRKFTDKNIPSVFPFVFINFLVVTIHWALNSEFPFSTISMCIWNHQFITSFFSSNSLIITISIHECPTKNSVILYICWREWREELLLVFGFSGLGLLIKNMHF